MKRPIPPPCRIIREGTIGICDICGSSIKRRWFGLGKVIGCLQPKCWNWHGWSHLPAGHNRPIDLYGAPEKPPYAGVQPPRPWPRSTRVAPCDHDWKCSDTGWIHCTKCGDRPWRNLRCE